MTTNIIPISNIVNVSLNSLAAGLQTPNVNSVALFTTELPGNLDPFRVYLSPSAVATDYGTNSTTYAMANATFAPTPNLLSGNGRLVIIPLQSSVSATSGHFVTANISTNLSGLIAVTAGDLEVILNGTTINLTGLNFTRAASLADIATILQSKLADAIVTATSTTVTVQSKKVGDTANVVLGQVSGGTGTDLSGSAYFHTSSGTATSGTDATGETIVAAMARIGTSVQYCIAETNLEMEDDVIATLASAVQAQDLIFVHHFASLSDAGESGIITANTSALNTKFRCLAYTVSTGSANLMKAAYVGANCSVDFTGSNTARTDNLSKLSTILPDPNLTQTSMLAFTGAGAPVYAQYGMNVVGGRVISSGANDFFDNVYNKLWLKLAVQVAIFNFLDQTNTKISQIENSMTALKGAIAKVCQQAVRNGIIGVGLVWNSSETFGDPATFQANITDNGFYNYSLPIAQQSQGDRTARIAPLVQTATKFAGAIHSSDVIINVEY